MKKKAETPKQMSEYEVDAMWMSYRYAIGRHTIAACMHACNMIKEIYHRLEKERIPFTVYDIRREINQQLDWNFNFGLSLYVQQSEYDPIKALVEFAKRDDVKKAGGIFKYLSNNRVEVSVNSNHEYEYNFSEPIHPGRELYAHELDDLLVWYNMSCALDKENHKIAVTEYEGKTEEHEVFEYVKIQQYVDAETDFAIDYVDINTYLENPFVHKWIAKEYIKKLMIRSMANKNKRYGAATKIFTKKEYQDWSDKIWEKTTEKGPDFLKDKENPFTNFMRGMTEIMEYSVWETPELKDVGVPEDGPKPVMYWFDQNKEIKEK